MNILFVTYDFPYPTNTGGKNRAYHLLKYTAHNASIFLYSFVREDFNPDYNEQILSIGVKDIKVHKRKKLKTLTSFSKTIFTNSSIFKSLYYEKGVFKELVQIIKEKKIDIVHFESSYTGFYIGKKLKKIGVKQVLGTENIEYKLYFEYAKNMSKFYLKPFVYYQAGRLKKEELEMVKKADSVTTVTDAESELLKTLTGKECGVVANGIDPDKFPFKLNEKTQNNILFVGNFSYFPNVDAINFFYKEVFINIDKKITLTIVGKQVEEKFNFNDGRVIMKDFVEDIIEEYRKADILVFPIRIGGGTNFKVLEAMALGIPIVANPERMSGLKAIPGEHFLEAINKEEYVFQIKKIYEDKSLREKLAVNSRELIVKNYAWDKIGAKLVEIWKSTL